MEERSGSNWSSLPWNLVSGILEKLSLIDDYVRFGAVCSPWHTAFIQESFCKKQKHSSLPFLLIPYQETDNKRKRNDDGGEKKTKQQPSDSRPFGSYRCSSSTEAAAKKANLDGLRWSEIRKKAHVAQSTRSLYSVARNMVYGSFHVSVPGDNICRGSSSGWLITVIREEKWRSHNRRWELKYRVQLLNPFLLPGQKGIIHLPPLPLPDIDDDKLLPYALEADDHLRPTNTNVFEEEEEEEHDEFFVGRNQTALWDWTQIYLHKAVLSTPPTDMNTNFLVMAILGEYCCLAFFDPSRKASFRWTPVGDWNRWRCFDDVIFFNKSRQFYAVHHDKGAVFSVALEPQAVLKQVAPTLQPSITEWIPFRRYIVELHSGDLLQVIRGLPIDSVDKDLENTKTIFQLHRLDTVSGEWVQEFNLGDYILFLGINASMSRPVSDFPECKPNCIYFTDDQMEADFSNKIIDPQAMGIYNLDNGTVQPHFYISPGTSLPQANLPIWFEPTLCSGADLGYTSAYPENPETPF